MGGGEEATSAKPTYSIVVTEEINVAPGCKHVSQAQDEVSMKENLLPARLFIFDGCMLSSQTQNIIPLQIKGLIAKT